MDLRAGYIDKEAADMDLGGMKHAQGLGQAGSYSHAYEGYKTATTGARVARARQFLESYRKAPSASARSDVSPYAFAKRSKITISNNPGGNVNTTAAIAAAH